MSKSRDIADSAATINYIDNVTSDVQSQLNTLTTAIDNVSVTSGTLTKTFTTGESSTINLTSSVLAPVVSVTKEVPQTGVTNNNWDVNSTTENYTRLNSAYATTLDWGDNYAEGTYASKSVSLQSSDNRSIFFKPDGTIFYHQSRNTDEIYQYTVSTAGDLSTATYASKSLSFASKDTNTVGMAISGDGLHAYMGGATNARIYQYDLSTAWDVSTGSDASKSLDVLGEMAYPLSFAFKSDGTKIYVLDPSSNVLQYSLSTAWDVSTGSYDSVSFALADTPRMITFVNNGKTLLFTTDTTDLVRAATLSTAWDLSTASLNTGGFSVAGQTTAPYGITSYNDSVYAASTSVAYQYSLGTILALGTGSFASADVGKTIEANSGVFVLTATDGSYVETTAPTSYAQVASGSWEMYGVVYNAADGDLELSGSSINQFDVSTAVYSQSFSVAAQEAGVSGIAFNTDGTKMFIVGTSGKT